MRSTVFTMHKPLAISLILFLLASLSSAPALAAPGLENFSGKEVPSSNLKPFPKWTGTLERYFNQQKLSAQTCDTGKFNPCQLNEWRDIIANLQKKPRKAQLDAINHYINTVRYILDPVNWGMADYWATPNEFFDVDGDCEDYAIAKFMSLRALGIPNEDMRIMIVRDMNLGGIIHGILAVRLEGETYILDNQIEQVIPARKIYHYTPVYSINETTWWRH